MPAYWTGISHPAKSIIRAPSAAWRSWRGVSWIVGSSVSVMGFGPGVPGSDAARRCARGGPRDGLLGRAPVRSFDDLRGPGHERTLGLERQQAGSLIEADPADPIELVIMALQIAADWLHEEIVDGLVDSRAALDEPVLDGLQNVGDPHFETGLLRHLAECRLLA